MTLATVALTFPKSCGSTKDNIESVSRQHLEIACCFERGQLGKLFPLESGGSEGNMRIWTLTTLNNKSAEKAVRLSSSDV
ncbi:hypothetical protein J6590_031372 [Homalodisca vitripennis]|nr:hypothetical protein J6590_031372 [Homalodisca vitripennis]